MERIRVGEPVLERRESVGHQAEAKNFPQRCFFASSSRCFIVLRFVKNGCPTIAAVNNVMGVAALLSSGDSRHEVGSKTVRYVEPNALRVERAAAKKYASPYLHFLW